MNIKVLIYIIFFVIYFSSYSQNQGIIHYKAEVVYKMSEDPEMSENFKRNPKFFKNVLEIEQNVSFLLKDTRFILQFKNEESSFEMEPTVAHEKNKFSGAVAMYTDSDGVFYNNIITKESIKQTRVFGKTFLVTLDPLEWETHNESKKISKYTCYKATANQKIELNDGKKKTFVITAWYTPEIPVSFGPKNYVGLPGLIMESDMNGVIRFMASELNVNPKKEVIIQKTTKGKPITEKELREKDKKAMENFRN
ncbi:GLPGLI family protein [Aquimarina muelleri]|uniref:GLPGLI family protein n=1 Tax=Aquimarina muelleri TaxID=279356 RepID=UPI003F6878DC